MKKRILKILLALSATPLLIFTSFMIYIQIPVTPAEPEVLIEKGMTLRNIAVKLRENGIIRHPYLFMIYAQAARKGDSLKAGLYRFEKPVTPSEVLNRLGHGWVEAIKVKIIEGWTAKQIANYLQSLPQIKDPQFEKIFLEKTKEQKLEGYLYPETYFLDIHAAPADAISQFVAEFAQNYQRALEDLPTLPAFSQHHIVTLASIIEKETGVESEKPIIASVFYNRMAKGMALQSDPTIIYGLKHFTGDIKKADIRNPHLYNTYVHRGLPPGPICNPGFTSIKAALSPAQTNYLYFVSKGDGTHHFSEMAKEHIEAVRKYQLPSPQPSPIKGEGD